MARAAGKLSKAMSGMALALALGGCAHHHRVSLAGAAQPAPAAPPRPVLAAAYGGVVVPPVDSDGHYRTINAGLDPQQTIWHVRAALNVAALSCRGPENAGLIATYNSLLTAQKAVLAKANKAVEASFRKRGAGWQDAHDRAMTQLYNFFAMPQASTAFCQAAAALAPRAVETSVADFPAFAATALMELEAPMIAVYQTIDDYGTQLAAWDARYGPGAPAQIRLALSAAGPQLAYGSIDRIAAWQPDTAVALR